MATAKVLETADPRAVVRDALAACDGNWQRAARMVRQRLEMDAALLRAVMWPFVDQAVWAIVRDVAHTNRTALLSGATTTATAAKADVPTENREHARAGLLAVAALNVRTMLDYPLQNGVKLGDADADALEAAIKCHLANARPNMVRARWLRAVKVSMGNAPKVRAALDDAALRALWAKANRQRGNAA